MRIPRPLLLGLLGGTAALGLSWAIASEVILLHPATLHGQVSFEAEPVVSYLMFAFPPNESNQLQIQKSFTPTGSSPYAWDLTVEGGDPADTSDTGKQYRVGVQAHFPGPGTPYLQVIRSTAAVVDNPTPPAAIDFRYPNTVRANVIVDLVANQGEQIISLSFDTVASTSTDAFLGRNSQSYSSATASATQSVPSARTSNVRVSGSATILLNDNTQISYQLTKTVDLSQGSADVHFTIDRVNQGRLAGSVAVTPSQAIRFQQIICQGVAGTPAAGVFSTTPVTDGQYGIDLQPGGYDIYLNTSLTDQQTASKATRVTVTAGAITTKDFVDQLATVRVPLTVDGFFKSADLSSMQMNLLRADPGQSFGTASVYLPPNGRAPSELLFSPMSGVWRSHFLVLRFHDLSNPDRPLDEGIIRVHDNDPDYPVISVAPGAALTFPTEHVTLVRANVYFHVAQAQGAPEVALSSPQIVASRQLPEASYRVDAFGSATPKTLSAFTVAAEPGTYTLDARATVNGTITRFAGSTITFGEPVETRPGQPVTLEPRDVPDSLKVTIDFGGTLAGSGVTTVVESPLGPPPPEGFQSACGDPANAAGDGTDLCSPIYYDIQTTAPWQGGTATVCVRRKFTSPQGVPNAAADALRLYHYNEASAVWEELTMPAGQPTSFDCSADSTVCGCASDEACGIDLASDPPVNVFLVCGQTTSFSPFLVGPTAALRFTNVVDGQTHTGATGPIQTWTVPSDGTYQIVAQGAKGATPAAATGTSTSPVVGGCGAEITGKFPLHRGDVLQILVGQAGTSAGQSAGGGGGSFVSENGQPLLVAGGGGGVRTGSTVNGRDAGLTTAGVAGSTTAGYTTANVAGGASGAGGARAAALGSGGGGWSGNGANDGTFGEGGFAFLAAAPNQGRGGRSSTTINPSCGPGADGGFGGGGAGNGCFGGGGGGGYSGGGSGRVAGGGGSFNAGANSRARINCATGVHGFVQIARVGALP